MIGAFLLIVSGECLKNCHELPFHITGRTLLGFVHSVTSLAVISYASEATTKKIRATLLGCVAVINTMAIWLATGLSIGINKSHSNENSSAIKTHAKSGTDNLDEYSIDDLEIVSFSGIIIMVVAILVLLTAPFITRETIPFLVRHRNDDKAHAEYLALTLSDTDSPDNFENWKESILLQSKNNVNIFKTENSSALLWLFHTRLLSLFFNSIFMSVMFTRILLVDEETNIRWFYNETNTYDLSNMNYAIELLLITKIIAFVSGVILILIAIKIETDRFCFKLSFVWGLSAFIVYVTYSCLHYLMNKPPYRVMEIFIYFVLFIPMIISFKFDVLQYQQIAKIYQENNNNYKLWSLVFVGCAEQFIQILLLLNIFLFPTLGALLTDFGIFYISLWLLKKLSNGGAIHPVTEVFRKSTNNANSYAIAN